MLCGKKQSYILNSSKSTTKVFLMEFLNKFQDIGKLQLLMHSHFLKKFLTKTLHFSRCWLFLKEWNNEIVLINITPPIEVYPPTNLRKKFVLTKFWQIFKLSLPIIMGRGGGVGGGGEDTMRPLWLVLVVFQILVRQKIRR